MRPGWRCIVPGCGRAVDPGDDMCLAHWARVPAPLRDAIERLRADRSAWTPVREAELLAEAVRAADAPEASAS